MLGCNPPSSKKYFQPITDRGVEESRKELVLLTSDKLKAIDKAATLCVKEAAQGEYLACLFLLLTDSERYGPLKKYLDNNVLIEEQKYPTPQPNTWPYTGHKIK